MKKSLPKSAVKESIDNLPAGLCFSLPSGMPLLINRVMYNLSLAIDGQSLQNAEGFWRTLTEGEIKNGAEAVSRGVSVLRGWYRHGWPASRSALEVRAPSD